MSKTIKAKVYCIAAGCHNNNKNSDHSFFALPSGQSEKETERCEKWLQLLGREDLLEKQIRKNFRVCSAHFDASSIKIMRMLTTDAYPTLLLPSQPQAGPSCSTSEPASSQSEDAGGKDAETQTAKKSEQPTETSTSLTKGTSKKRKPLDKQKAKKVKKWYYEPGDESQ